MQRRATRETQGHGDQGPTRDTEREMRTQDRDQDRELDGQKPQGPRRTGRGFHSTWIIFQIRREKAQTTAPPRVPAPKCSSPSTGRSQPAPTQLPLTRVVVGCGLVDHDRVLGEGADEGQNYSCGEKRHRGEAQGKVADGEQGKGAEAEPWPSGGVKAGGAEQGVPHPQEAPLLCRAPWHPGVLLYQQGL